MERPSNGHDGRAPNRVGGEALSAGRSSGFGPHTFGLPNRAVAAQSVAGGGVRGASTKLDPQPVYGGASTADFHRLPEPEPVWIDGLTGPPSRARACRSPFGRERLRWSGRIAVRGARNAPPRASVQELSLTARARSDTVAPSLGHPPGSTLRSACLPRPLGTRADLFDFPPPRGHARARFDALPAHALPGSHLELRNAGHAGVRAG